MDSLRIKGSVTVETPPAMADCPLLSRRQFLRGVAAGAAVVATSGATARALASSGGDLSGAIGVEEDALKPVGMLIDLTRCTGCNACALACKEVNDRPDPATPPQRIDYDAFSFVDERPASDRHGNDYSVFVKRQCMHCVHAACASACTVGALRKTPEGPVVYDSAKCIGCRYCQYACPFGVPAYEWDNPLGLIGKCDMCMARQQRGEVPACVASCPNGAIRFGKRDELLAQAHAQIQSNPGRYVNHVYGEAEAGGTSMLYLAPVPFSSLGFPVLGDDSIPLHAEAVMKKTPVIAVTVAALAALIQFLTRQRGAHEEFLVGEDAAGQQHKEIKS